MKQKSRKYEGEGIVVEYDLARCIHAAECVRGLPQVFDPEARPWIQPANAPADAIAEVVQRCPTGALRYERTDGGPAEAPAAQYRVRIEPNGPLFVEGDLRLRLPDGEVVQETRVALCRCGESKNKPFCDNSHVEKGFEDPGHAVESKLGPRGDAGEGTLTLSLAPNGPVLLEGPVSVVGADGVSSEGGKGALCRCGASAGKPYCDGTHKAIGFEAD